MLTQITLLALASGALRLGLLWVLRRKFGLLFVVPQAIAGQSRGCGFVVGVASERSVIVGLSARSG